MFQAKTEDELTRLFILARYVNADYRLAGVPDDFPASSDAMSFDPQVMRGLFDAGYRGGKDGSAWRSIPPGIEQEPCTAARTGTKFATSARTGLPESWRPERLKITLGAEDSTERR